MAEEKDLPVEEEVKVGDTVEETPQADPIPDELEGLPEDIARETMEEANPHEEEPQEEEEAAETDSDNKQDYESLPNQRIPYSRFKKQVDKTHELESQIAELRKQIEARQTDAPTMQPIVQQPPQSNVAPPPKKPVFDAQAMTQVKQAIENRALAMTGMTKEDVEALEWADDDDVKKQTWNTAHKFAEQEVIRSIYDARQQQMEQSRRVMAAHNENVLAYNQFTQKEMAEPDYPEVANYAKNEYFNQHTPADRSIIARAYYNIEHNNASPQDTLLIRNFYTEAKRAYRSANKKTKSNNTTANKVKQGQAFPRSGDIDGSSDNGAVTIGALEHMLETKNFEDIPEHYQKILLGEASLS